MDRLEDSDKFTAATLAASLIAAGHSSPAATNTDMAATQAVEIYRAVLEKLQATGEKPQQ
ncbi:hypothetical protein [Noviluteimonas gilva]|uniref:Uncharacterized protein n=1 Tax=Noviluteimonas gilva TaxID=2682097 RepID=A0A7C9HLY9_9GAMM|nr:hypothetical protein [Lysobacter gilvus]MUV14070.1 hypothetical protein [Lysobacter gilvus]